MIGGWGAGGLCWRLGDVPSPVAGILIFQKSDGWYPKLLEVQVWIGC